LRRELWRGTEPVVGKIDGEACGKTPYGGGEKRDRC